MQSPKVTMSDYIYYHLNKQHGKQNKKIKGPYGQYYFKFCENIILMCIVYFCVFPYSVNSPN